MIEDYLINKQINAPRFGPCKTPVKQTSTIKHVFRPLYRKVKSLKYLSQRNRSVHLPDFFIIGTQKSGTSSLHHYLSLHPEVLCPDKKEIHFFDYYYDYGMNFYRSFFDATKSQLVGEATPEYIFHPYCAQRIKKDFPNSKAIVLLRDPVERAFSAWRMGKRQGWETLSFEDAINVESDRVLPDLMRLKENHNYYGYHWNHHSYLLRGFYSDQVENWLKYFDRDQLLILSAESFYKNTLIEYKKVCDFLGLPEWYPENFENMFVGFSSDLALSTRDALRRYYRPYNEKLFSLVGEEFDW